MSRFGLGFISGEVPGNDSFTKVLLHMDGTNGGTSFPDVNVGGSAHTWTPNSGAVTTAFTSKFGPTSLASGSFFNYVSTPDHADFTLGTNDFTVDFWWNPNGNTSTNGLCGQGGGPFATSAWFIVRNNVNTVSFICSSGAGITTVTTSSTFTGSSWVHVAAVRASNVLKLFINGVQEGGDVAFGSSIPDVSSIFAVGQAGTNTAYPPTTFTSYFDEFRFSNGIARWTANFTPPVAPYT